MSYPASQHISAKRERESLIKRISYIMNRSNTTEIRKGCDKEFQKLNKRMETISYFLNPCHDF